MSSHTLKKSPIALTYSRIVEGVTESTIRLLTSKKKASYISEYVMCQYWSFNSMDGTIVGQTQVSICR